MNKEKTYLCTGCKEVTHSPVFLYEKHTGADMIFCPYCGSGSLKGVEVCPFCKGKIDIFDTWDICPKCREELKNRFRKMLAASFSPMEIAALNEIYQGDCF